jgi:hypothetical protein
VIDVVSTVLLLGATVAGASADGARGALWGVAAAQGVLGVVWWAVFWGHPGQEPAVQVAAEPVASVASSSEASASSSESVASSPLTSAPVPPAA